MSRSSFPAGVALAACLVLAPSMLMGASVIVVSGDAAGVGFNDPTPVAPVGGNTGTTLGQQRMIAFQAAASKWGATVSSNVAIRVKGVWSALTCTPNSAVLGSASPVEAFKDFPLALVGGHWYPKALANKLTGSDLDPANFDIFANFNVNLGNAGCLTGVFFYLGLDNNHGANIDLVTVLTHEFAHGLGFLTFTDGSTGTLLSGFPSIWDDFLLDNTTNKTWTMMTNGERIASAVNTGHLVWNGGNVTAAIPQVLQPVGGSFSGADPSGRALMYSPNPFQQGSSVSHWDNSMFPDQLMEPVITADLTHEVTPPNDLTYPLLKDIGWAAANGVAPDLTITKTHAGNFIQGQNGATYTITVSNSGTGPTSGTVTVTETVPSGLTATGIGGVNWNCAQPSGPCTRSDALAVGNSYPTITLTVNVAPNSLSVVNTVVVSGGGETNTNDNTANDSTTVTAVPAPDLTITKSHTGNFAQGQTGATYTITVKNSGTAATSGTVTVTDTLPGALTAVGIAGNNWTCTQPSGPCTRNDALSAGASYPSIVLTVNVAANATNFTNTSTVSGGGENTTSNDTANDPTTIVSAPDLTITKTHPGNFLQGQNGANYTITVKNSGAGTSSGTVTVTDTVPAGLTATAISGTNWNCTQPSGPCTRSDGLGGGLSFQPIFLTVNVAANATNLTNTATVSGGGETNTSNDTANDFTTVIVSGPPDLTISKTHSGNFSQGQHIAAYTITVSNLGPGVTSGTVTVTDTLPAGLNASSIAGNNWNCTQPAGPCTRIDSLAAGSSYPPIIVTVNVTANATNLTNTATVSGGGETNTSNDTASDPTTVTTPQSGMSENFESGGAGWTITGLWHLTNNSTCPAPAPGYSSATHAYYYGQDASCNYDTPGAPNTGSLTSPAISGITAQSTLKFSYYLGTEGSAGFDTATVYVVGTGGGAASVFTVSTNDTVWHTTQTISLAQFAGQTIQIQFVFNTVDQYSNAFKGWFVDDVVVTGAAAPDLTISKAHSGNFTQGQTGATYTITATNSGTAATSGTVTVTETVPTGLTATAIAGSNWSCTQPSGPCTRSDALAVGNSYPAITLTVNVAANASNLTNTATVSGGGETNTNNDTATDPTTVTAAPAPDMTIAKTHSGNFTQGQTGATYTITATNSGNAPTSGTVTVTETVPTGLTATAISGTNWNCTQPSGPCTRSDALTAGNSYPGITLTVNVAANAANLINTATVAGGGETNTSNDTANDSTTIIALTPDLTITKTHTGNFTQGQTGATYTITVTNSGTASTSGAVTMTETVPTGLTATSISGTNWNCTQPSGPCTRSDALTAGNSYPAITLTVNVAANAANLTNTATVAGGGETNTSNDTANDPTVVVAPLTPDLTITKTHTGNFTQSQTGATYTITVKNSGTGPTTGTVTMTETVPTGLTATAISGTNWNCTQPAGPCTRSDVLAANGTYPALTLTVNVAVNATNLINTATVAGGGETNTSNDTANDSTTINPLPLPDLTIAKTHTGSFTQGQNGATYTITVSNGGTGPTSGTVTVTDTVPSGLTATAISGTNWNCTQPSGPCTRSDALTAGLSYPAITLTVNVAANATNLINTATVGGGGETNTSNDTANDSTTINGSGSGLNENFESGGVGWTADGLWHLASNSTCASPALGYSSATHAYYYGQDASCDYQTGASANTGSLTSPAIAGITAQSTLKFSYYLGTEGTAGFDTATVYVVLTGGSQVSLYTVSTNDTAWHTTPTISLAGFAGQTIRIRFTFNTVDQYSNGFKGWFVDDVIVGGASPVPDLTITKTHTGNFTQGQNGATYTITVGNSGTASTSGAVTMTETVPTGLTATAISGSNWNCTQPSGPCTRADALAANSTYPAITLTVNVAANATNLTNTAMVSGGGESNTNNDTANDPTTVSAPLTPDLTITKTHTGNFTQGQTGAAYTITVRNSGTASTTGAVTVTEAVPTGLTATAISGSNWNCTQPSGPCTRSDALAANNTYPAITLTVTVAANATNLTNTATVGGGGETNTSNDTATDPTTIAASGSGLSESFENGAVGWTANGLWHLGNNSSCASPALGYSSPTHAYYYGQDATCTYDTPGAANTGTLTSPAITGITAQSTLKFSYYLGTEGTAGFDTATVYVVLPGGSTVSVYTVSTNDTAWHTTPAISLAAFAGQTVQVRFIFNTVDQYYNTFKGWFVDDVVVQ